MLKIKAIIKWDNKDNHPDSPNIKAMQYEDTYTIDPDHFYGVEDIEDYIKNDLALVAGGGYKTDTIENVSYKLEKV